MSGLPPGNKAISCFATSCLACTHTWCHEQMELYLLWILDIYYDYSMMPFEQSWFQSLPGDHPLEVSPFAPTATLRGLGISIISTSQSRQWATLFNFNMWASGRGHTFTKICRSKTGPTSKGCPSNQFWLHPQDQCWLLKIVPHGPDQVWLLNSVPLLPNLVLSPNMSGDHFWQDSSIVKVVPWPFCTQQDM